MLTKPQKVPLPECFGSVAHAYAKGPSTQDLHLRKTESMLNNISSSETVTGKETADYDELNMTEEQGQRE
jgi:hypothetical protein